MSTTTFQQLLRRQMDTKGMLPTHVARACGVSDSTVTRGWLAEKALPRDANLAPLSDVLGVPLDELLDVVRRDREKIAGARPKRPAANRATQAERLSVIEERVAEMQKMLAMVTEAIVTKTRQETAPRRRK